MFNAAIAYGDADLIRVLALRFLTGVTLAGVYPPGMKLVATYFGYLGHMCELYAMWTWVPIFLLASYESAAWSLQSARLASGHR